MVGLDPNRQIHLGDWVGAMQASFFGGEGLPLRDPWT